MELEKIFESILREGQDEDLAAYNKASNRFDRQKRSIYGLASNELSRLNKADGITVTLDCGGYELEVAITPSIGRLRLNNHEFDKKGLGRFHPLGWNQFTIFAMFLGVMLFAQSYTVIRVVGANDGPGIAKMNNIGPVAASQELVNI